jgi:hypothetical protein
MGEGNGRILACPPYIHDPIELWYQDRDRSSVLLKWAPVEAAVRTWALTWPLVGRDEK